MVRHLPLVLVLITAPIFAGPSPSINYLMNQPVSMLEWGIYRLELQAQQWTWENPETLLNKWCHVDYDWNTNQLQWECVVYPHFWSLQKTPPKQLCGSVITQVRDNFGVGVGWDVPGLEHLKKMSAIGRYFHHGFFERKPATLDRDIEAITYIHVHVLVSKTDRPDFSEAASCEAGLVNPEIRYFRTEIKK